MHLAKPSHTNYNTEVLASDGTVTVTASGVKADLTLAENGDREYAHCSVSYRFETLAICTHLAESSSVAIYTYLVEPGTSAKLCFKVTHFRSASETKTASLCEGDTEVFVPDRSMCCVFIRSSIQMQSKPNEANTLPASFLATNPFTSSFDLASVSEGDVLLFRACNRNRNLHETISIRLGARDVHSSLMPSSQMQSTLESKIAIAAERKQQFIFIGCITAVSEGDVLQASSRNIRDLQLVRLDASTRGEFFC
jgi:hypothetical protein